MLLLDIGNTHTRIARYVDGEIRLLRVVNTADATPDLLPADADEAFGVSVAPAAARRFPRVRFIGAADAESAGLLDFSAVDSSTLGADRVANAVAAAESGSLPALVADCGSAITLELIDARRRFLGGAIAPGRLLLRRTLHANTAQLPEIPLSGRIPAVPGTNTAEALRFGIDRGAVGMVRELIAASEACYGAFTPFVTGGDAPFFAAALGLPPAPEDFTLRGVLRIAAGLTQIR